MRIPRHSIDDIDDLRLNENSEFIKESLTLTRRYPDNLNLLQGFCFSWAGRLAAAKPESPDLLKALRLSCQAGAAELALASHPGETLEFPLGEGPPVHFLGTGPTSLAHAAKWLGTFQLAIVCRDDDAFRRVLETPTAVLRASPTTGDEYIYLFVDALRAAWQRDPRHAQYLIAAMEATDPTRLESADVDIVLDFVVPMMEIFFYFIQKDVAAFNDALAKALRLHSKYWGTEERRDDPDGFIALGPLAMAALAHDKGVPVEVESDYMPAQLVRGDWLRG